jgi:hypothetical protein
VSSRPAWATQPEKEKKKEKLLFIKKRCIEMVVLIFFEGWVSSRSHT